MKTIFLTVISVILVSCNSEVSDNSNATENKDTLLAISNVDQPVLDSLSMENDFANSPFDKVDNIKYFNSILKNHTKIKVKIESNQYDADINDTIKIIYFDKSIIKTLTNKSINKILFTDVVINDNNIVLKNDIRIGQSTEKVFESLKIKYDSKKAYKFLDLTSTGDATSYLTFHFKDNILYQIVYEPYSG
jgi:hypothetical protein